MSNPTPVAPRWRVAADGPLPPAVTDRLPAEIEILPWRAASDPVSRGDGGVSPVAIYTYGHPIVDAAMLAGLPDVRVISNYGVGVDHIDLAAAAERGIPVGNTPGVLDGATADMAFTLLLACGRRLVEGDRYARSPKFTEFDPGYMLGREIHGATLGILGMGSIGSQIARRATGFDMKVLYHNRNRVSADRERELAARYAPFGELLRESDYLVLSPPLTDATRGIIGATELDAMKPTACLVNIGRGPLVNTAALTDALARRAIYAAALDVTDPEPLPRDHPLLAMDNVTIAPHLGSATVQTRGRMAELSVENLLAGLRGEPLPNEAYARNQR